MTAVPLTEVWINLASDPDNQYVYFGANETAEVVEVDGERRRRADGSTVSVRLPGTTKDIAVRASMVSRTMMATLQGFVGQRVLFRDTFSRSVYGVFYNLSLGEMVGFDSKYGTASFEILVSGTQTG